MPKRIHRNTRKIQQPKFKSNFEKVVFSTVSKMALYESEVLNYIKPETKHKYTPDIIMQKKDKTKMYLELKGRFRTADERKKYILVKQANPSIDLRFVFMNPNLKIRKSSKTTYRDWAEKNGFEWAGKTIPMSWIMECK